MGIGIVRFEKNNLEKWGVVAGEDIKVLQENYPTLKELLQSGRSQLEQLLGERNAETVSFTDVTLLSPVTKPARIICQGANYASHREESGMEAKRPAFNLFFGKTDSTLTGAYSDVIKPAHVELLDYEIELGLVIGKEITEAVKVTDANLADYITGLVITNDVSARDVQLTQGQWLKGKSYRTFCPTGPILYLLDKDEVPLLHNLELNLWVNDELRQSANTDQLLFKPTETLTELSEMMDLSIGDLVLSGTTGGVAMNLTPDLMRKATDITLPLEEKLTALVTDQLQAGHKYLNEGDVISTTIKSADGKIDLGEQKNRIVNP